MARKWIGLIGAAVLWACACAGAQESTEPSGGGGDVGVTEVVEPGNEGGEVVDATLVSQYEGGDEASGSEPPADGEVIDEGVEGDPKPEDGGEEIERPEGGEVDIVPILIAEYDPTLKDIVLTALEDGGSDIGSGAEGDGELIRDARILTLAGENSNLSVASALTNPAGGIGVQWWTELLSGASANPEPGPRGVQLLADIGLNSAERLAAINNTTADPPAIAGQLGTSLSQVSSQAADAFAAIRVPSIPSLPANE